MREVGLESENDMKISAPWTDDQVKSLNEYQQCDRVHPFTGRLGEPLIATKSGWISPNDPFRCVVQTWAHPFMLDWSWKKLPSGLKERAYIESAKLTKERRESIARSMREVGNALRSVAEQADKSAVALEGNDLNLAMREIETFHKLISAITTTLGLVFAIDRKER